MRQFFVFNKKKKKKKKKRYLEREEEIITLISITSKLLAKYPENPTITTQIWTKKRDKNKDSAHKTQTRDREGERCGWEEILL